MRPARTEDVESTVSRSVVAGVIVNVLSPMKLPTPPILPLEQPENRKVIEADPPRPVKLRAADDGVMRQVDI